MDEGRVEGFPKGTLIILDWFRIFMNKFMELAIKEARKGIRKNDGGPFGAVVVRRGKVVGKGHNQVIRKSDPTAHAEIVAIRQACKKLGRWNLKDCELYSTCEPCPMCFAAIEWANIRKVTYGCTSRDAAKIGFEDKDIYDAIRGKRKADFEKRHLAHEACLKPFHEWSRKKDRKLY